MQVLSSAERMGGGHSMPLGLPPESFHPINGGVDFREAFILGMRGPYEVFAGMSSWDQAVWRFKRWKLHKWTLVKRGFMRQQQYFVLW